jgi:hypothetical protein
MVCFMPSMITLSRSRDFNALRSKSVEDSPTNFYLGGNCEKSYRVLVT